MKLGAIFSKMPIYQSFQIDRAAYVLVFVFGISNAISYGQDVVQPKPVLHMAQDNSKLKPAAPRLDTSRPETSPSVPYAPPAASAPALVPSPSSKHKPSTLQGKIEHSRTMSQPHSLFGLPGNARGGTNDDLYRQRLQQQMLDSGITTGIGIIGVKFILFAGHSPIINRVFPLTPAASAGLQPYDVIVAVDGIPTRGLRKEEVYDMIIGTPGTPVMVSIERDGDFKVYNLTRMNINDITDPSIRSDYFRSL
jgi:hypothetical protein